MTTYIYIHINIFFFFFPLSLRYFNHVLQQLTETSGRPDHQEFNLRMTSHEALNLWIENCAVDCLPTVTQLVPAILTRLQATLQMSLTEQTELHPRSVSSNVLLRATNVDIYDRYYI